MKMTIVNYHLTAGHTAKMHIEADEQGLEVTVVIRPSKYKLSTQHSGML